MIDNLFKKVSDTEDEGIMRELLLDFYNSSGKRKPDNIIIFRDGVSESQFNQVLNIELDQIIEVHKLFKYAIYIVYISVIRTNIYFELIRHASFLMKNVT
ncbi:hypothetical protein TSUD_376210 [Trifolium subterraneum]|uniref:Piwi domain-containing protein n=1 Tax=Trifolium subterraneum TaxID=3900 RepID=A0A2Z6MKW5_TRISU|nr:hypothetical protein TSUD_376210 [Trifolium subterraneum]